jgi:hypothetical protein
MKAGSREVLGVETVTGAQTRTFAMEARDAALSGTIENLPAFM